MNLASNRSLPSDSPSSAQNGLARLTARTPHQASNARVTIDLTGRVTLEALHSCLLDEFTRSPRLNAGLDFVDGEPSFVGVRGELLRFEVHPAERGTPESAERASLHQIFDLRHGPVVAASVEVSAGNVTRLTLVAPQLVLSERALLRSAGRCLHAVGLLPLAPAEPSHESALPDRSVDDALRETAPLLEVAALHARPPVHPNTKGRASVSLDAAFGDAVVALADRSELSPADVLFAGAAIVLARYAARPQFAVSVARDNDGIAEPCPVPVAYRGEQTLGEFARQLRETRLARQAPDAASYQALVSEQGDESPAYNSIFQVSFEAYDLRATPHFSATLTRQTERLDLELFATLRDFGVELSAVYADGILDAALVQRLLHSLAKLLSAACADPKQPASMLPLLAEDEYTALLSLNATGTSYDADDCVHHVFERQAEATPERLAYVCDGQRFSYRAMNELCNRLAHQLCALGVGPEVPVVTFVGRSHWLGVSSIAVMKSGGVYVPIDPAYPSDRIGYMLNVVSPQVIVTTRRERAALPASNARILVLDEDESLAASASSNLGPRARGRNTAYILFTSGTTGRPKAIQMSHRAFRNMPVAHRSRGLLDPENRVLQFASVAFAVCLGGSFMAWSCGGALFQVNDAESVPGSALFELLVSERINMVSWPVSLLASLPDLELPDLKTVISTAEPCTDAVATRWCAGRRFINMYGSSEVAMGSTLFEWIPGASVSLGRPFPNNEIYVVDEELNPVPSGVVGEICIAGSALANGYLHRPDATAEKFMPDPFSSRPGARLYRTGDLGRYLPNGEIQYVGRNDFQVSVRGFRIEMVEVEKALLTVPQVLAAAVAVRPDPFGRDRLIGYVVNRAGHSLDRGALRRSLARTLPDYMIPSLFVGLSSLPLTPNRKLDRSRLPEPDLAAQLEEGYEPPDNAIELTVAEIWARALKVERIGRNHSFFQIGGHSLLAAIVVSEVKARLGVELPLRVLIENDTIRGFANEITRVHALNAAGGAS